MNIREMTGPIVNCMKAVFVAVAVFAFILSANSRSVTHDVTALAKIVADHHDQVKHHGHAHEDVVNVIHAYTGHSHDKADHDHNIAFLPPSDPPKVVLLTSAAWSVLNDRLPDRHEFGLDRPPGV